MAIIVRLIQQYHPSKKQEFYALEKQFAELEHRGILPRGERFAPIAGRRAGNTIVWECRFYSLASAETVLKQIGSSAEHTYLVAQQTPMCQQTRVDIYQVLHI